MQISVETIEGGINVGDQVLLLMKLSITQSSLQNGPVYLAILLKKFVFTSVLIHKSKIRNSEYEVHDQSSEGVVRRSQRCGKTSVRWQLHIQGYPTDIGHSSIYGN